LPEENIKIAAVSQAQDAGTAALDCLKKTSKLQLYPKRRQLLLSKGHTRLGQIQFSYQQKRTSKKD
jgi:hypothetical protein